jgi:hypothetical protein
MSELCMSYNNQYWNQTKQNWFFNFFTKTNVCFVLIGINIITHLYILSVGYIIEGALKHKAIWCVWGSVASSEGV